MAEITPVQEEHGVIGLQTAPPEAIPQAPTPNPTSDIQPRAARGMAATYDTSDLDALLDGTREDDTRPATPNNQPGSTSQQLSISPSVEKFGTNWARGAVSQVQAACDHLDVRIQTLDSDTTAKFVDIYTHVRKQDNTVGAIRTGLNSVVGRADQVTLSLRDLQLVIQRLERKVEEQEKVIKELREHGDSFEPHRKRNRLDDGAEIVTMSTPPPAPMHTVAPPAVSAATPQSASIPYPSQPTTYEAVPEPGIVPQHTQQIMLLAPAVNRSWTTSAPTGGHQFPAAPRTTSARHPRPPTAYQPQQSPFPYHIRVSNMTFRSGDNWTEVARAIVGLVLNRLTWTKAEVKGLRDADYSMMVMFTTEQTALLFYEAWKRGPVPREYANVRIELCFQSGQLNTI
ncbi:hypothetical protein PQX77_002923 [Marasmius sp. AFHP31]|nr:hypothetical protein PQX77_002923 [Marasmius sp. AFHP31]